MRKLGYSYNDREKWSDPNNTKNNPRSCGKSHSFCHMDYEWGDESSKIRKMNCPINSSIPNVILPAPKEGAIVVNYDSITQENLDDWVAQSMNRNIISMLNAQKKFYLPSNYEEEIKQRYRHKKPVKFGKEEETYFGSNHSKKQNTGYMGAERKKKFEVGDLLFDHKKLQPQTDIPGTSIRVRETKKQAKLQVKRRSAILLDKDIHYERLLTQMKKDKAKKSQDQPGQEQKMSLQRQRLYSYNIESIQRESCYEKVPNSIIECDVDNLKSPMDSFLGANRAFLNKQEQLDERYRLLLNQKAQQTVLEVQKIYRQETSKQNDKGFPVYKGKTKSLRRHTTAVRNNSVIEPKQKIKLEDKVLKLLNDMQVSSEKIDLNMAKFNVHCSEIFLQHPDSRPQVKWILKAQDKIKERQNMLAIDCYMQAIILQPEYFIPIFNIAVLLEKERLFESSKRWFNLANQFQSDSERVQFGTSLVALKQLRYQQALEGLNELILKLEAAKKNVQLIYYYTRAICEKQLGLLDEAKTDYQLVERQTQPSNYNVLAHFTFSILFAKARRVKRQFDSLSYIKFRETLFLVLYKNQKKVKEEKENYLDIGSKLVKLVFLKRFSLSLINKLIKVSKYEIKEKGNIIFVSKHETVIILSGIVSMKSHEKNFKRPDTVGLMQEGGVIGTEDVDNSYSRKPNIWFLADSEVEFIKIPREYFNDFWKGQITFEFDFKYNFLRNVSLFKGLPETTMFKLVELFELQKFEKNTILFNDCSYRVTLMNNRGHGFGLGIPQKTDPRFLYNLKPSEQTKSFYKTKGKHRISKLIKKHIFKFNQMKFNRLKYPGIFVVKEGLIQLQNDMGFRCKGIIGEREFFGENLLMDSDGLQKYGRMVVESETAELYVIDINQLIWVFTEEDKQIMLKNTKNREIIETVRFLNNRFKECVATKVAIHRKN